MLPPISCLQSPAKANGIFTLLGYAAPCFIGTVASTLKLIGKNVLFPAASQFRVEAEAKQIAKTKVTENLMRIEHYVRVSLGLDPKITAAIKLVGSLIFADRLLGKLTMSSKERAKQSVWPVALTAGSLATAYWNRKKIIHIASSAAEKMAIAAFRRLTSITIY